MSWTATFPPRRSTPKFRGFTLIELMVVVALLAILAALAAPSFADSIRAHRIERVARELMHSMELAKVESARTGQNTVIRRIEPCAAAANNTQWACGWELFVANDGNRQRNNQEVLVLRHETPAGALVTRNTPVSPESIVFRRQGYVDASTSLTVLATGNAQVQSRRTCLSLTGRARLC